MSLAFKFAERNVLRVFIRSRVKTFVSGRPFWWQWFTILSLDATVVAVTWQALFGRVAGVHLVFAHRWILASSVWCAYSADRWIEGWRLTPERTLTQRHYFSVRWRWPVFVIWCAVITVDLLTALLKLKSSEFNAGLLLLVPVLLYVFSHQFLHRHHPWRLPKEVCVATLMSGGVLVFLLAQPQVDQPRLIALGAGFAVLCFVNCALISVWEREIDESQDQDSLARQSLRVTRFARVLPWLVSISAFFYAFAEPTGWTQRALLCIGSSAGLLGGVDRLEPKIGRQLARVLSDAVLLTPLVFLSYLGAAAAE